MVDAGLVNENFGISFGANSIRHAWSIGIEGATQTMDHASLDSFKE